jgi:Family of unknown function (DUF6297)
MMSAASTMEVPDSTDATLSLLAELRRGHVRKQAANLAYWLYLGGLLMLVYGGWLVAAVVRALGHPPPALTDTAALARAEPAGLCALALAAIAVFLWDARWCGPVVVAQPTADWLLDTPVRRARLLRPRYRASVLIRAVIAAVVGLVPAALILSSGLDSGGAGRSLRLAGVAMLSTGLLAALGTGLAAVAQKRPGSQLFRQAMPVAGLAAVAVAGIAVLAAASFPPAVSTVLLWSGPWGWAAQGLVAMSGGAAPSWPTAVALLAVSAITAVVAGDRAAAGVPAAALRARARMIGSMSAAIANLDVRRVGTAYRTAAGGYGRARFAVPPPLRRELVLPWRDIVALVRAPTRLAWAGLLSLAAAGLGALAAHSPDSAVLPLAGALVLGYLAASSLCEGARLDADDTRRSAQLPFRYDTLVWWHAIVPSVALAVLGGVPAAALAVAAGKPWLLVVVPAAIVVLVAGALVNVYRGPLEAEALAFGFETPFGNTGSITVVLWYVTGPLLAIGPLIWLGYRALSGQRPGAITTSVILSLALATWLGSIATRRARRLRSS